MFQSQKEASSFSWPFFFHSCHAALKPSWNLVMSAFLVLKLTVHSPRQIVPVLDHFRDKFHLFFAKNVIHHQTNKLSYQIPSRWKLLVFWLNLLLAFLASSHQTGRLVVNLLTKISHPLFIRSPEAVSSFRDDRAQRGGGGGYYSCPSMTSAPSEEEEVYRGYGQRPSGGTLKCATWGNSKFFCVASWPFFITWCSFERCLCSRGKA